MGGFGQMCKIKEESVPKIEFKTSYFFGKQGSYASTIIVNSNINPHKTLIARIKIPRFAKHDHWG
jgi:hypothetical protein